MLRQGGHGHHREGVSGFAEDRTFDDEVWMKVSDEGDAYDGKGAHV